MTIPAPGPPGPAVRGRERVVDRGDVEQRLIRRHPDVPPGVILAAVARAARRARRHPHRVDTYSWSEIEQVADEQLLLRQMLHLGAP